MGLGIGRIVGLAINETILIKIDIIIDFSKISL